MKNMKFALMSVAVDTGASVTMLSDQILSRLGYTKNTSYGTITTASGSEQVFKHVIPKIRLGEVELTEVEVYAHNFPYESSVDGVLGMNVLAKFNFTVNFDKNLLILSSRERN
jgi:clan AA aspartic protease (TIGR02281 family)